MKCDRCHKDIPEGEERRYYSETLCEDCYMDALSPAKACDPWAVYNARAFGDDVELTETQENIINILMDTGGVEPGVLMEKLGLQAKELERELATLRHMEKIRGEKRGDKIVIRLW
jgi:hypothetical protein